MRPRQARSRLNAVLPHAFGLLAFVARWTWCAPTRGGRGVRYARMIANGSRFVRIIRPTILSRRYVPAKSVQSSYLTLSGCVLLSQGGPGLRLAWHRRQRQELRRHRFTARLIGGFDNHCDGNNAQHDRASHGQRGRDVLIPPERLQEIASQACDA
jgi:hypothetical protein